MYIAVQRKENVSSSAKLYGKSIALFRITTKRLPACIYIILSMCNFKKGTFFHTKNELAGLKQI